MLDDVGIEHLAAYPIGSNTADTALLDDWDTLWLRFDDAWSNPECSPTRTTIQTGKYGHETGVGRVINCDESRQMDLESLDLLPKKFLSRYATGAFGKWHMGTDDGSFTSACTGPEAGLDAPIVAGYDYFEGIILDIQDPTVADDDKYFDYEKTQLDPPLVCESLNTTVTNGYQTRDIADAAVSWIEDQLTAGTAYFAYVAFTAAHTPLHCPPQSKYPEVTFDCVDHTDPPLTLYHDMIEALSVDIDRIVSAAAGISPSVTPVNPANTLVILVGDNGSPAAVALAPVSASKAKGTVFQGGVRVPFLAWGADVTDPGFTPEGLLVGHIDLYATILETVGATYTAFDSVDLSGVFDANTTTVRDYLYTEWFYPNFDPNSSPMEGPSMGQQAIRDDRYKYIRTTSGQEAFFDLDSIEGDPWEGTNLIPLLQPGDPRIPILVELRDEMDAIQPDLLTICELEPVGEPCMSHSQCCSRVCHPADLVCVNPPTPQCPQP